MEHAPRLLRTLEGPGSTARAERLQRRFRQAHAPRRPYASALRRTGRDLLVLYWIACLGVIAWSLDRLYPHVLPGAVEAVRTHWGDHPFPNCAAAHAAGVYDIPDWSAAYIDRQDGDHDGLACEPPP